MLRRGARERGERGQVIILMILVFTIIFFVGAIVVDVGLWLSERRSMQRAADFASLAGSIELPADPAEARTRALDWAARNGFAHGTGGVSVEVVMLCSNGLTSPPAGICHNPHPGSTSACVPEVGCDAMRVMISKPGIHLFSGIFSDGDVEIDSGATVALSFGTKPLDTVLLLDDTGSMAEGCNSQRTNAGCPVKEAKDAAHNFAHLLLTGGGGQNQVGYAPYRGCYTPPRNYSGCSPASAVRDLTTNQGNVNSAINQANGAGGSRTNVCGPFVRAQAMFDGPNAQKSLEAKRSIVILTDGDNNYAFQSFGQGEPAAVCRPTNPTQSDVDFGSSCSGASQPHERQMDSMTRSITNKLKASPYDAEIYVVALGVCGSNNPAVTASNSYCGGIGNTDLDTSADRRLLKCIASSSPGTNDHYFEVATAAGVPAVFQQIAFEIAGRALTE